MQPAVIIVVVVVIIILLLLTRGKEESFVNKDTLKDYQQYLAVQKQSIGLPPPTTMQLFMPSIQSANPTVKGVTIHNSNGVFKISSMNAGMLTPETARSLFPEEKCKGKTAFEKDMSIVRNSLELSPTQEQERMQLAAAQTNYIPEAGLPPNMLWYNRTTTDRLTQPGLDMNLNKEMTAYIQTQSGHRVPLRLEIASTPYDRALGLMFRKSLNDLHGMLFVYHKPSKLSVWMKNTFIPLDILFLDSQGVIQCIRQGQPHDLTSLGCYAGPSQYMIELPLGNCQRYGIQQGDQLFYV